TKTFTSLNRSLLLVTVTLMITYFALTQYFPQLFQRGLDIVFQFNPLPARGGSIALLLDRGGWWLILFLILLPIAMTMALTWKIKEVILSSVFGETLPHDS